MTEHPVRVLLGPQRPERNLTAAVTNMRLADGPLAVISAGWQEAEGYIDDVRELIDRPLEDLRLYGRAEEIERADPGLAAAARERQERLIAQQRVYRMRLKQLGIAFRQMLTAEGDSSMLVAEQRHAVAQLRALDRHHLNRTEKIWHRFLDDYRPDGHEELGRHRTEIVELIERSAGVVITGGNVAVLLNRLRLFGLEKALAKKPIVAWSAGAMVLTERIVLFHDRSPEGRRDAEVLGSGCGIVSGYILFPDTARRLNARNQNRIGATARRFEPDLCVALDSGAELHVDDDDIQFADAVKSLNRDGRILSLRAA